MTTKLTITKAIGPVPRKELFSERGFADSQRAYKLARHCRVPHLGVWVLLPVNLSAARWIHVCSEKHNTT